jgi:hypothetical protein
MAFVLLDPPPFAYANDEPRIQDDARFVDYLLAGWKAEREKLVSGLVEVDGYERRFKDDALKETVNEFKIRAECAFDNRKGLMRTKNDNQYGKGVWILRPEGVFEWLDAPSTLVTQMNASDRRLLFAQQFDPRRMGFESYAGLSMEPTSLDETVKIMSQRFALVSCKSIGDGKYSVKWKVKSTPRFYTLEFDEKRGFTVVRGEVTPENPTLSGVPSIYASTSVHWIERNGTWVPKAAEINEFPAKITVGLAFNWKSVNETVPEDLFNVQRIGAKSGTLMVDNRKGREKSILTGRIGDDTDSIPIPVKSGPISKRTQLWVLGGLLSLLLLTGAILFRRFRARVRIGSSSKDVERESAS